MMKKKVLSVLLAAAMTVTMLAGCGSSNKEELNGILRGYRSQEPPDSTA